MKTFTLTIATALLAIVSTANAESSANSTTSEPVAPPTSGLVANPRPPAERLTYADFQMVRHMIDFNFQRLKSVRLVATQCHMNVDRVNHLFQRYAHEDAEQYLANLKRAAGGPFQKL